MPTLKTGVQRARRSRSQVVPAGENLLGQLSEASLSLERIQKQNRANMQKKDSSKTIEPSPASTGKGKPRLLLMGQRR